jgi:hypothetical protein
LAGEKGISERPVRWARETDIVRRIDGNVEGSGRRALESAAQSDAHECSVELRPTINSRENRSADAIRNRAGLQAREREKRLLIDEPIRGPHSLRVAIGGVDEFDVMAHHANHAKMRIDRSRNTFESLEKLLHFLMLAGFRMLVGRIELVFGQAAIRIGTEREGLLSLYDAVLSLHCGNDCEQTHHRKKSTGAFLHV